MYLRHATEEDIDFILQASRDIHGKFGGVEFNEDTTLDTIYSFLDKEDFSESMMVVAFDETGHKGVIAAMLSLTPFSTKVVATELLFWTDGSPKAFKALHSAYRIWAEKAGANVIMISAPPTKEHVKYSKFYKNLGYEPFEYKFIGDI